MREVPDCLNRRYQALDELIKELSASVPSKGPVSERSSVENNQIGIKLMCDFWNILKDDPDCNLTQEVQQRMGIEAKQSSCMFGQQHVGCYMANKDQMMNEDKRRDVMNRIKHISCPNESKIPVRRFGGGGSVTPSVGADKIPLSKVLCNLKEAASFDKKCNVRVAELIEAQKELTEQIQALEEREKAGVMLLKQADCMWSCMEDAYKKKVAGSQDKQKLLLKELKEVEVSANKWRKNNKDLDFQQKNINKCYEEITEKINQKKNDVKIMDMEIEEFKKRIQSNVKDIDVAKNSWRSKKEASDARLENIAVEMGKVQKKITAEQQVKSDKEQEGTKYVKDAREDLQKICRVLLQKKLQNEDLRAEKDALIQEIDLLKKTCEVCKEKCTNKEKMIEDEVKRLDGELAVYKAKCVKCHECTDTIDVRKFCTDCPRCLAERDCLYEEDHCSHDHTMDCVCMGVKQKFLDNVFDNMYTVLERQSKTCPGKAVADCIFNCLKRSRNGKLNAETRKVLQDFILSTVKKNLNLTIVGGAVKTRCEMDQETYKQLMLCLKEVTVPRPAKEDKGTAVKKEPCRRWGGTIECNCPKGPKACICTKKAPPPPTDPTPCGHVDQQEMGEADICPHKNSLACGTDCGRASSPDLGVSGWKRDPCQGQSCPFSKNMRAAQCVLGPEPLASVQKTYPTPPIIPNLPSMEKMATCTCGGKAIKPCPCRRDTKQLKAAVKDDCDKSTCANFWEQTEEAKFGLVPSVQKDVLFRDQKQEQILKEYTRKKQSPNATKEQFKVAIENEDGQSNDQFTELTETKSGRLAMELDEKIIELIEKKSKEDPYLFVSLKRTDSGHLLFEFDVKENELIQTQRVIVRRTASGTRLLDMHKDMISVLKNTLLNDKPDSNVSKSMKLSHSPKRQESPNQMDTVNNLPPIDLKKQQDLTKLYKELENESSISTSMISSINSTKPIPKRKNKDQQLYHPPKLINEGKVYERGPDSSSWKSLDTDQLQQCIKKETDDCICSPPAPCTRHYPQAPPITYHWKPESTIKGKNLPMKNANNQKLECICPKTTSNLICCKLPSEMDLSSEATIPDKNLPLNNAKKTKLECPSEIDLSSEKTKPECICPKTTPNSVSCKLPSEEDLQIKDIKTECQCPQDSQTSNSWKSATSGSVVSLDERNITSELKKKYEEGNTFIVVKIRTRKGVVRRLPAIVTKTPSGTLAIYGKNLTYLAHIGFDEKEYPVLLTKTFSGTYFIGFGLYDRSLNATLRKTPSGGTLIVPKSKTAQERARKANRFEEFFKVKVTGVKKYPVELPAVLKTTLSDNYIIVLDKEFEKRYRRSVNEYIADKGECVVDLNRTNSGNYAIDLDTEDANHLVKRNALLIKSSSGNIKILVHGLEFESMVRTASKKSSSSSAKAFGQLVNKLPASSREFHRENLRKSKHLDKKASSDTQLYEKVMIKFQDSKKLFSEPTAVLKKTASGQYAIVLNKESKKAFINNLQSYLATNSQGLVPIKRSESGEIIINLNNDETKGNYGSLKITSSGNIYVMVDEEVIKGMAKDPRKNDVSSSAVDTRSKHVTKPIEPTLNKAVATTCNAKPDDYSCDATKCVCDELKTMDWLPNNRAKQDCPKDSPSTWKKVTDNADYKNAENYCSIAKQSNRREKSPHIVIKPACDCSQPPTKKKFGSTEQCYYVLDTVCPYHKDRYDAVSNELLEISGLCNNAQASRQRNKIEFEANSELPSVEKGRKVWDSLNYLPPQLPPFLRNVSYQ